MTGFKVALGGVYVDPKGISVSDGSTYVAAKGVYVSQGNGTWTPVWPLLSTVSLSSPAWAMSSASGQNPWSAVANTIVSPTFTVTLSNPSAVGSVSLQLAQPGSGWVEYKNWSSGIVGTLAQAVPLPVNGVWQARAVITHTSGSQVISNVTSITSYKKSLTIYANGTTAPIAPAEGSTVNFSFACADDCAPGQIAQALLYTTNGSPWTWYSDPSQNASWPGAAGNEHWWVYRESFADGSIIHSQYVSVDPVNPYHITAGMNRDQAQAVLDSRVGMQVLIQPWGGYDWSGKVYIRSGQHIVATESTFVIRDGIVNAGSVGGYGREGGWTWEGGTFDGMNVRSTMFSLAHAPSFTITGVRIRGCKALGHGIEINSSGGPEQAGYTVNILNNVFDGVMGHRTPEGSYDEAIHVDYAWGPTAATANPVNDGTVTNNVLIQGNTVEDTYEHNPTGYPVGFGSHKFSISEGSSLDANGNWIVARATGGGTCSAHGIARHLNDDGEHRPLEYHAHHLVQGNRFVVSPYSGTIPRGAVHLRGFARTVIQNNTLSSPSGAAACTHNAEYTKSISGNNPPTDI